MANAKRDQNFNPTIQGVSSLDGTTPTDVWVNPSTGAVLVDGNSLYGQLDDRYLRYGVSYSDGTDIGAFEYIQDYGYATHQINDKSLHNIRLGGHPSTAKPGSIRYNKDDSRMNLYTNTWENVITRTEIEEQDMAVYSQLQKTDVDAYGVPILHGNNQDIGAFSTWHKISGGSFDL